ncbi:TolC family outer membrane protein [Roseomonas sp. NAR14]|uniref:TolC family outer membrane protein n=1 Tax=Roseomonas acroporae TaxID=2937791 RepID=A0A9X1Y607_9PROT|nr:TolC family outer membrane protein [Roseomonas acroporae]MCK8783833.1 TolC family outer membrane protein [Roseomonas acroporae]
MSRTRPPAAFVAALALAAVPLAGTQAQTLQEALALTYSNNPTLLTARAQLRVVDENVPQALAGWRPTVVLQGSAGYSDGNARSLAALNGVVPQAGNSYELPNGLTVFPTVPLGTRPVTSDINRQTASVAATITQPLYRGGRTTSSTRRAENQVLAQRARLLATEQQVLGDSVNAYVGVIQQQEVLRINTNNVQVLNRQLEATNERFRVGEITRTDVAQNESRLAAARATRQQSEGQLQTARATFQRLVGRPPGRLTAPQPLTPAVRTAVEAGQLAAVNNPNVVAALFDESAARDLIDVQFSQLLPQVSLQGQAARNDNAVGPHTRVTANAVTITASVPLYQGGIEYSQVRQARQQAQQARSVVEDQRRLSTSQATQAWETLFAARATVESQRAAIRAAEIALDGVQREAIVGSRTTLDVLNAEQEVLNNRIGLVNSLTNLITASYALAASVGRLTARDLALPVQLYDMESYYREVRNRWAGLGDYARSGPQPVSEPLPDPAASVTPAANTVPAPAAAPRATRPAR